MYPWCLLLGHGRPPDVETTTLCNNFEKKPFSHAAAATLSVSVREKINSIAPTKNVSEASALGVGGTERCLSPLTETRRLDRASPSWIIFSQ